MPKSVPFEIDVANLDEIRRKIPEVEQLVEEKREAASVAQKELAYWLAISERLRLLAGKPRSAEDRDSAQRGPSVQSRVVEALTASDRAWRAPDLRRELLPDVEQKTVGWALWKSEREGLIKRISPGVYSALSYEPDTGLLGELESEE